MVRTTVLVTLVIQEMVKNAQVNNHVRMANLIFSVILSVLEFLWTSLLRFDFVVVTGIFLLTNILLNVFIYNPAEYLTTSFKRVARND
jgi:hypothetical protein